VRRALPAIALLVLLAGALLVGALPGRAAVAAGVAAAEAEDWDAALGHLLPRTATRPSATALYDAGTVWYRRGDPTRALACWRAAREHAPRSDDLAHDIALARAELPHATEPVPAPRGWMEVITPGELGGTVVLLWLALSWAAPRTRSARDLVALAAAMACATALSLVALDGRAAQRSAPVGVTLDEAVVRDAPELEAGERFVLGRGAELRAERRRGPFVLVTDGLGRRGWVLSEILALPDAAALGTPARE
jgi:hypothetical protein